MCTLSPYDALTKKLYTSGGGRSVGLLSRRCRRPDYSTGEASGGFSDGARQRTLSSSSQWQWADLRGQEPRGVAEVL